MKKRKRNPKGVMPPALKKYWAARRRKSNPRGRKKALKRGKNPLSVPTQHVLYIQQGLKGPVLKYLGGIKFGAKGHAVRFPGRAAALETGLLLKQKFPVLKPYRMWST